MAKKKDTVKDDALIGELFDNVTMKYGGMTMEEMAENFSGLRIPTYGERYIRDSNVYVTGKIEMYAGPQGAGKSSYGYHVGRTFVDAGGYFFLIETENKTSPASLLAHLGPDAFASGHARIIQAGVLTEEGEGKKKKKDTDTPDTPAVQKVLSDLIKLIKSNDTLRKVPIYILVDSILGAPDVESRKEFLEEGQNRGRSTHDLARAAAITRFMPNVVNTIIGTNVLIGMTNHGKDKMMLSGGHGGPGPSGNNKNLPGGAALAFFSSLILWFERGGKDADVHTAGRIVNIGGYKNSFGDDTRKLEVCFRYDNHRDAEGKEIFDKNGEHVRVLNWKWDEATGYLVLAFCHRTSANSPLGSDESRHILNLTGTLSKVVCPELDIDGGTVEDLGRGINAHPEVEHMLRAIPRMGVNQYRLLDT